MIPKTIYICHKNIETIKPYAQKWLDLNPNYKLELYDDNRCQEFLINEFSPDHLELFNFIKDGPIKADFWRLCILYKYGGVYADADIVPLVPLSEYINPTMNFVTCLSVYNNNINFNPHFIMSEPNNEKINKCISWYLVFRLKKEYSYWGWSIVQLFNVIFKDIRRNYAETDNANIQILYEKYATNGTSPYDFYCEYKNVRVMNCRHIDYDYDNHVYKESV
jgi:hypothetical protein